MTAFIYTGHSLTIHGDDNVPHTVHRNSPVDFDAILAAARNKDYELAVSLMDVTTSINTFGEGKVTVEDGVLVYDGKIMHDYTSLKVLDLMDEGFDIQPMLNFLENLMLNPSKRAVDDLYSFLEYGQLPITEDGHFLAWKSINADLTDRYTGTFDNSPGQVVKMPRNKVNEDPDVTCSHGLHVCSKEYLPMFGVGQGCGTVIVVKVNPRDVVAIPRDYNNTKMRCCEYEVMNVHTESTFDYDKAVVDTSNYHSKRDSLGRFVS